MVGVEAVKERPPLTLQNNEIVVVVNGKLAGRKELNFADALGKALLAHGNVNIHVTKYRGHAREIAATAVKEKKGLVVGFGGDGIGNEIGQATAESETAYGVVPAGLKNVLAEKLGMAGVKNEVSGLVDVFTLNTGRPGR